MAQPSAGEDRGERLVERLREVRRGLSGAPARARREALRKELDGQLRSLPAADRGPLIERALGRLRPEGGGDPQAERELGRRLNETKAKLDDAVAERAKLARERDAAIAARDAAAARVAAVEAELAAKRAAPAGAGGMDGFRAGLKAAIEGKKVDPASLGLAPADGRLFRLVREMIDFLHMLEVARAGFLKDLAVGAEGGMGTRMWDDFQRQVRRRVLAVLNDEPGSVKAVQEVLKQQNEFVFSLPEAFRQSIPVGTKALLDELDPEPILETSKRFLMTDWEKAWGALVQARGDLVNLTKGELWERYFKPPFKEEIGKWTGGKR